MRKHDVFGKKISKMRPFYLFLAIIVFVFAGYFAITQFQDRQISELETEQTRLESEIALLLENDLTEEETILTAGDLSNNIPQGYFQYHMETDIDHLFALAGLSNAEKSVMIANDVPYPVDVTLPEEVRAVRINLSFVVTGDDAVIDLLYVLLESERLYDVTGVDVTMLVEGDYDVSLTFYAFYRL